MTPAIGQGLTDDEIKSFVDMNVKNIYKKHKRRGRQEGQSINVGVRKPREANDTAEEEIEDHPHPFHRHPRIHKDSKWLCGSINFYFSRYIRYLIYGINHTRIYTGCFYSMTRFQQALKGGLMQIVGT